MDPCAARRGQAVDGVAAAEIGAQAAVVDLAGEIDDVLEPAVAADVAHPVGIFRAGAQPADDDELDRAAHHGAEPLGDQHQVLLVLVGDDAADEQDVEGVVLGQAAGEVGIAGRRLPRLGVEQQRHDLDPREAQRAQLAGIVVGRREGALDQVAQAGELLAGEVGNPLELAAFLEELERRDVVVDQQLAAAERLQPVEIADRPREVDDQHRVGAVGEGRRGMEVGRQLGRHVLDVHLRGVAQAAQQVADVEQAIGDGVAKGGAAMELVDGARLEGHCAAAHARRASTAISCGP